MFRDQKAHTISGKRADFQGQSTTSNSITVRQSYHPATKFNAVFDRVLPYRIEVFLHFVKKKQFLD